MPFSLGITLEAVRLLLAYLSLQHAQDAMHFCELSVYRRTPFRIVRSLLLAVFGLTAILDV
jgi:hypothetical protein